MKRKCRNLKQTCIRTAVAMVILVVLALIYGQLSFTTEQTFRRMESCHSVPHSQIVYTNRGSIDTIFSTTQLDYTVYSKEDVYLGQRGGTYYFAAIEKAPVYIGNGASNRSVSNTFITFHLREGETLATTWNLKDLLPEQEMYSNRIAAHYIAGVITDPSAAKVEAEIWFNKANGSWYEVAEGRLEELFGGDPPWTKTVETTEFYSGMFLIYTGYEFSRGFGTAVTDYGYTITVYDANGNMIAQHDQPMSHTQAQDAISPVPVACVIRRSPLTAILR